MSDTNHPPKRCPSCNAHYDAHVEYCFVDGATLIPDTQARSSSAPRPSRTSTPALPSQRPTAALGFALTLLAGGAFGVLLLGLLAILVVSQTPLGNPPAIDAPPEAQVRPEADIAAAVLLTEVRTAISAQEYRKAQDLSQRALDHDPTDPALVKELAEAVKLLQYKVLLEDARTYLKDGDYMTAENMATDVLDHLPTDKEAVAIIEAAKQLQEAAVAPRPRTPRPVRPAPPPPTPPSMGLETSR